MRTLSSIIRLSWAASAPTGRSRIGNWGGCIRSPSRLRPFPFSGCEIRPVNRASRGQSHAAVQRIILSGIIDLPHKPAGFREPSNIGVGPCPEVKGTSRT